MSNSFIDEEINNNEFDDLEDLEDLLDNNGPATSIPHNLNKNTVSPTNNTQIQNTKSKQK